MKAFSLVSDFWQWFKRLRHSKGFGVHSPFAFMLVNEIINCRYRYYGYDDVEPYIDSANSRKQRRLARLLIRITGRVSFERFVIIGEADRVLSKAVEVADSRVEIVKGPVKEYSSALVYIGALCADSEYLRSAMHTDGNVLIFDTLGDDKLRMQYESLVSEVCHGVVFEDTDMSMVFIRRQLPMVKYLMMI